jgi:hypothetical protein
MKKYKKWSKEELDYIAASHSSLKDKELAKLLSDKTQSNITVDMVRRQRRKLQLRKKQGRHKSKNLGSITEV